MNIFSLPINLGNTNIKKTLNVSFIVIIL